MTPNDIPHSNIKEKLKVYAVFAGYSALAFIGIGYISYKAILLQFQHHFLETNHKQYRKPFLHPRVKYYGMGIATAFSVYICGLYLMYLQLPENLFEKVGVVKVLPLLERTNPKFQQQHIYKPMKFFGVSQQLQNKANKQFEIMKEQLTQQQINMTKEYQVEDLVIVKLVKQYWWKIVEKYELWSAE